MYQQHTFLLKNRKKITELFEKKILSRVTCIISYCLLYCNDFVIVKLIEIIVSFPLKLIFATDTFHRYDKIWTLSREKVFINWMVKNVVNIFLIFFFLILKERKADIL